MRAALVNECRHASVIQILQPTTVETKILTGKVFNRGSEIHLAVKPGLDGVLIGRQHIGEMTPTEQQRTDVIRDELLGQ